MIRIGTVLTLLKLANGRVYRDWLVLSLTPDRNGFEICPYYQHKWTHNVHVSEILEYKVKE